MVSVLNGTGMANEYTPRWFASFMATIPEAWTTLDVHGGLTLAERAAYAGFACWSIAAGGTKHARRVRPRAGIRACRAVRAVA